MQINSDRRFGVVILLLLSLIVVATVSHRSLAAERCTHAAARLVSLFGTVEHRPQNSKIWQSAQLDAIICPGDFVRTGARSRAAVIFFDTETVLRIDQNTTLRVRTPRKPGRTLLDLLKGAAQFFSRTPRALEVDTPFVNAAIEGTEFFLAVGADQTALTVFEGKVNARNQSGQLIATDGQSLIAKQGAAPRAITVVRPRDAVQWALYYPPVLSGPDVTGSTKATREAAALLAAGRVNEAAAKLRTAGDAAPALALRAVIAVAQNDKAAALSRGRAAVAADPNSGAARIALSYALQASFDIVGARNVMQDAVARRPGDALAWARLAELDLSLGARDDAVEAAAKAAEISPDISRMNTVLGFAALARFHTGEARSAFERAIREDSQDPLPRLGLGLAKIRDGDLAEGRREIEIATALDPGSSINRSYMGKAYFEEGSDVFAKGYFDNFFEQHRFALAAKQFEIAKELDPKDPTPWFYDALRKQSQNDPVGALRDIQKSIDLNDNRAVYRSRLLLDQDRASRGVSLARIYQDLGFEQLAINEGAKSIATDPANHSAHRFLSDSFVGRPRYEIARASELLQSQLLQPITNNPVQPQSSQIDLNLLPGGGPFDIGFNEFTRQFERDRFQLFLTGATGNEDTRTDEVVLSGIQGRTAFSFGQFHYKTDGFRPNDDVRHDIFNGFAQASLSEKLDVQFEFRRRISHQGDVRLNFDPFDFSEFDRRDIRQSTVRAGAHYAPAPGHDLVLSGIYSERKETFDSTPPAKRQIDSDLTEKGRDLQMQYIYASGSNNLTLGAGTYSIDSDLDTTIDLTPMFPPGTCPFLPFPCIQKPPAPFDQVDQHNAYIYGNAEWPRGVKWTLGASYDYFDRTLLKISRVNPKVGLQWDAIRDRDADFLKGASLRLAYMKGVRRVLIVEQTLEPTQIAGFNQFFDDRNGSVTKLLGLGLDFKFPYGVRLGVQGTRRFIKIPLDFPGPPASVSFEGHREDVLRGYLYGTLGKKWAIGIDPYIEKTQRDGAAPATRPLAVKTYVAPLHLRYFAGNGLFAQLGATYLHQKIDPHPASTFPYTSETTVLADAAIGYRLPNRLGVVSFAVRNLFDTNFRIQDPNIQGADPSNPRFLPDRTFLFRATLTF